MKKIILLSLICVFSQLAAAQYIWDAEHLAKVKQQTKQPMYAVACRQLMSDADKFLAAQPVSVMQKNKVAVSGDKHDYLSQAPFYWQEPYGSGKEFTYVEHGNRRPQLYTVRLTLGAHTTEQKVEFRHFEFREHGPFYLNGRRLLLQGTHRHEDYAGVGAAMISLHK